MTRKLAVLISIVCGSALFIVYRSTVVPSNPLAEVAQSHIEGNTPAQSDFDMLLQRDLTAYFASSASGPVTVKYEFLRDGPTQTGIAFPKYYLWVRLLDDDRQVDEGAIRVAAIEQQRFEVTHYLPRAQMKGNPDGMFEVFPLPVCEKIKERLD